LLSVIIPCFNSEAFIKDALESVFAQDLEDFEIIVVDDGSTDSTLDVVAGFDCVRVVRQDHGGACRARNKGIEVARGKWIKFLDLDDLLRSGTLAQQLEFAEAQAENVITHWDVEYFDDRTGARRAVTSKLPDPDNQVLSLLNGNIQTSCPLHRRLDLKEVGGFYERFLKAQEYELHIRLALKGFHFVHLPICGSMVREHDAPWRITIRALDPKVRENGLLRGQVVLNQIKAANEGSVPPDIQALYCKGVFDRFFQEMKSLRFFPAMGSFASLRAIKPSAASMVAGLFQSLAGFTSRLRNRLWHYTD
jgi:glycosyltransferase involved in cell wall biosynthesis